MILTSDNPRFEDPLDILQQMETGIPAEATQKVLVIPDRREAIFKAAALAAPNDALLVAGKGHETYQEISGIKYDFDDRAVLREAFAAAHS